MDSMPEERINFASSTENEGGWEAHKNLRIE